MSGDRWIMIPALEQKFRFKLPTNCHMTKSITAAISHASKIAITAQKKQGDGEVSIDFGLHMNDGPLDDTLSAHSHILPNSPSQARLAHRHEHCKTSVSILQTQSLNFDLMSLKLVMTTILTLLCLSICYQDHELDHFEWKSLNLPEDWRPHAQMIYQIIMIREGQHIMHEAFQIVANEKVKKDALSQSMS